MIYIESPSNDPHFNLALEQYVFDHMDRGNEYFMLWQNNNTIVVGKNQNTAEEVNQEYVDQNGIQVVRRLSGGGAVYHDMGNLNFTFIMDSGDMKALDFSLFCEPVIKVLAGLGVTAGVNGRNDIVIDGQKFSGNSQYIKKGRVMHHGTILYNSDLSCVANALNASKHKIQSKGIKSVRSRVTNVSSHLPIPISLEEFKRALLNQMSNNSDITPYPLNDDDMGKIIEIQKARYDLWNWNYGASPPYNVEKRRRIENCGEIILYLDVHQGIIRNFHLKGDFFGSGELQEIADRLTGCPIQRDSLVFALKDINIGHYINNITVDEFIDTIVQ